MKVGIIRHFKVNYNPKKVMSSSDFEEYVNDYDFAPVIKNEVYLSEDKWDRCYCSDLSRACITAESVYKDNIEKTKLLREVKMYPFIKSNLRIPTVLWSLFSRTAWKLNHSSQIETSLATEERAREFLRGVDLDSNENILIVSHGFFLITLVNELKKLGFKGDIPKKMQNGVLYILEK